METGGVMNAAGWVTLLLSWFFVTGFCLFLIVRTLHAHQPDTDDVPFKKGCRTKGGKGRTLSGRDTTAGRSAPPASEVPRSRGRVVRSRRAGSWIGWSGSSGGTRRRRLLGRPLQGRGGDRGLLPCGRTPRGAVCPRGTGRGEGRRAAIIDNLHDRYWKTIGAITRGAG